MAAAGQYRIFMSTPIGDKEMVVTIVEDGNGASGTLEAEGGFYDLNDVTVDGDTFSGSTNLNTPMGEIEATLTLTVDGDSVSGELLTPFMPIVTHGERI